MDVRHKHHAVIWVVVLIVVFVGACAWYVLRDPVSGTESQFPTRPITPTSQTHAPVVVYETGRFYEAVGHYPSAVPLSGSAASAAAATLKEFVTTEIAQFIENGNFDALTPDDIETLFPDGRKYTLDVNYAVSHGPRTLSYTFDSYTDTFGAHPNVRYTTFTFDTSTGELLSLKDLFTPESNALTLLSERSRSELPSLIAQRSGGTSRADSMLIEGTAPTAENFDTWVIEDTSLVIQFQSYQVGPYVLGPIELPLSLESFGDTLRPEYQAQ